MGIDTVSMNGDGFQLHVKEGDRVHLGDKLITFDPEKIKAAGYSTVTAVLVTNSDDYTACRREKTGAAGTLEKVFCVKP